LIITTKQQIVNHVLPALLVSEMWAHDNETTGLKRRKDKVIGFGISDGLNSFYLVHMYWDGQQLVQALSKEECASVLRAMQGKKLVYWNFGFDISFTENYFGVSL